MPKVTLIYSHTNVTPKMNYSTKQPRFEAVKPNLRKEINPLSAIYNPLSCGNSSQKLNNSILNTLTEEKNSNPTCLATLSIGFKPSIHSTESANKDEIVPKLGTLFLYAH